MSSWNRYRTFEDFEHAELWESEIVSDELQALDGDWDAVDTEDDDEEDDVSAVLADEN